MNFSLKKSSKRPTKVKYKGSSRVTRGTILVERVKIRNNSLQQDKETITKHKSKNKVKKISILNLRPVMVVRKPEGVLILQL